MLKHKICNSKAIKSVISNSTYGNQISIALRVETKHRVPFVLDLPRHGFKAALFALYQDSGAKDLFLQM